MEVYPNTNGSYLCKLGFQISLFETIFQGQPSAQACLPPVPQGTSILCIVLSGKNENPRCKMVTCVPFLRSHVLVHSSDTGLSVQLVPKHMPVCEVDRVGHSSPWGWVTLGCGT